MQRILVPDVNGMPQKLLNFFAHLSTPRPSSVRPSVSSATPGPRFFNLHVEPSIKVCVGRGGVGWEGEHLYKWSVNQEDRHAQKHRVQP